jgi:hypothetical protein
MVAVIGTLFVIVGFGDLLRHGILLLVAAAVIVVILLGVESSLDPLSRRGVADMLRQVLDGTMDWHLWDYLTSIPVEHDPLLYSIQTDCLMLMDDEYWSGAAPPHIFNEKGLQEIRRLLEQLEQAERWQALRTPRDT